MVTNNLIKIDFSGNPTAINLDAQVSLRDIYNTLVERGGLSSATDFSDWVKQRLQFFQENQDYKVYRFKTENPQGGRPTTEYSTSVLNAMQIVAEGHGAVGHEMRRFMSGCVRLVNEQRQLTPTNVDGEMLIRIGQQMVELERERDRAVRTKAQISERREATAMGKLSAATKTIGHLTLLVKEAKINSDDCQLILEQIGKRRTAEGLKASATGFFYKMLKQHFGLSSQLTWRDIPKERLAEAVELISTVTIPTTTRQKHSHQ